MQVSRERKVDWDDDDPYQIPDNYLPKHKGGELLSKDEEIERDNNPPEVEIEENKEKPGHLQSHPHNHEEKIGNLEGDAHKSNEESIEQKKEIKKVDEQVIENKPEVKVEEAKFNDPLTEKSPKLIEEPVVKDNYPSLHEISRQVDEEKQKNNPKEVQKKEKQQKSREGNAACKKCVVQ